VRSPSDSKSAYTLDVSAVEVRDPIVVVYDEGADHVRAITLMGSRTVNRAPPSLTTVTSPPCL